MTATAQQQRLLLDEVLPRYDVRLAKSILVDASPETAFDAACDLDLLTVRTPITVAAFWVRTIPARLSGRPQEKPTKLSVRFEGHGMPGWMLLSERPGREIVFGVVGRFWKPDIEWHTLAQEDFADFDEPGWGKIACNFAVEPHGSGHSVVVYECRVATTDAGARKAFARYWWLIRPFVAHIMGATVRAIKDDAERLGT